MPSQKPTGRAYRASNQRQWAAHALLFSPSPIVSAMDELQDGFSSLSLSPPIPHLSELVRKIITTPEVCDCILDHCSPAGLICCSKICKFTYEWLQSYYRRGFNINRHLSRYFDDPVAFRSLQARTGTLIAGSNALQFLDRSFYPKSDLDLYADGAGTLAVGLWLIGAGYTFEHHINQKPEFLTAYRRRTLDGRNEFREDDYASPSPRSIADVFNFMKATSPDQPPLKVQIISAMSSPWDCVIKFHSTCVLNFITHNKAYSLYPRATFEDRKSILCHGRLSDRLNLNPSTVNALRKYHSRGWKIVNRRWEKANSKWFPPHITAPERRRTDDGHTWIVPLDTHGVEIPKPSANSVFLRSLANDVVALNWRMDDSGLDGFWSDPPFTPVPTVQSTEHPPKRSGKSRRGRSSGQGQGGMSQQQQGERERGHGGGHERGRGRGGRIRYPGFVRAGEIGTAGRRENGSARESGGEGTSGRGRGQGRTVRGRGEPATHGSGRRGGGPRVTQSPRSG